MRTGQRGFIWMEILVAVSASLFISLVGIRLVGFFLERWSIEQAAEVQWAEINNLGKRVQWYFDERTEADGAGETDLVLIGEQEGDGLDLQEAVLQSCPESGERLGWKLRQVAGYWEEVLERPGESEPEVQVRRLQYCGNIIVRKAVAGEGGELALFRWTFPDATHEMAKDGFAIFGFW